MPQYLAFDIGTSAGRAMVGTLSADGIALTELHRFSNRAVFVRGTLYWDILYLWGEILNSLQKWPTDAEPPRSIGLDTWAVDFALLDANGSLLDNPVHNRDARTNGMLERVFEVVPRDEIYTRTGIQFMQINTLYQLYALALAQSPALRHADTFLTVADLLNYWLTGRKVVEFTSATCTQCYDPNAGGWTTDILARLGLPTGMWPEVVAPGTVLGNLDAASPELADFPQVPVIAVATHDTASAVAAVPATVEHFVYISSGTWSLMGTEVRSPIITPDSLKYNFTNEGGVNGTFRLLKNILGMWLVQACQEAWSKVGRDYAYPELIELATRARPFGAVIDPYPNSPDFRWAADMPDRIQAFCARTAQPVPADDGEILRCIFESLALKYRQTLEQLQIITGHDYQVIHIVGGGARNGLLCQMTADATRRPVVAGPSEATTLGNLAVQAMATGQLASIEESRHLIRRSADLATYEPSTSSRDWDDAYARFLAIAQK